MRNSLVREVEVREPDGIDFVGVDDAMNKLSSLGFVKAAKKLETAKRLAIAYAKYGHVTQTKIDAFNDKLRIDTMKEDKNAYSFKRLLFTPIGDYHKIPPAAVLQKVKEAMDDNCFDSFEVATIQWVKEIKDPIVFGRIDGCSDRFFIAQWDDDVSIEQIIEA